MNTEIQELAHIEEAHKNICANNQNNKNFIFVTAGNKNKASVVSFIVQDGPIKEVGINGCQVTDMLEYVKHLYISLNAAFPCDENASTINCIEDALFWQKKRTADREKRGVEGFNKD